MSSPFFSDSMFSVFPVLFFVVFAAVVAVILVAVIRSVTRSVKNQNAPILTVDARIVAKRSETGGGMNDTPAWTRYFATFEVASGDRLEFRVSGEESGMLAEGDEGKVTFQGTRYISFVRRLPE
jgi:hypothetical protein